MEDLHSQTHVRTSNRDLHVGGHIVYSKYLLVGLSVFKSRVIACLGVSSLSSQAYSQSLFVAPIVS